MSALTPYFSLTLPTQGGDNNTWGIELNNDITSIDTLFHDVQVGELNYAVDSSVTANTITVALSTSPAAYTAGLPVTVKVANTVTGATTINVNSLGAQSVTRPDGSALQAGDIIAGQVVELVFDGTRFILNAPSYINLGSTVVAQANGGTGQTSLAAAFPQQKTQNGYIQDPGGIIDQWMASGSIAAGAVYTQYFPEAFPNLAFNAQVTIIYAGTSETSLTVTELNGSNIQVQNQSSVTVSIFTRVKGY